MNRKQRHAQAKINVTQQPSVSSHEGWFEAGLQYLQAGRLEEAEQLYRQVLEINPSNGDVLHLLGLIAYESGRHARAVEMIREAIEVNPNVATYYFSLGNVLGDLDRLEEAVSAFNTAVNLQPNFDKVYSNLGNALNKMGRFDEAVCAYNVAIKFQPNNAIAHSNLGNALRDFGRLEEAVAACNAAIKLQPDYSMAYNNLGNALRDMGRLEEAVSAYSTAIKLQPNFAKAYSNLGTVLQEMGRLEEAVAAYTFAIKFQPDLAVAHYNLSYALLHSGDFLDGWREYEWRWQSGVKGLKPRDFAKPQWRGEDINGRTILLHAEQGLGDTIQFCRYATLVAERGARIIMELPPPLLKILGGLQGIDQLITTGDPLPDFDVHCPLLSLPLAFETQMETIPAQIPYLFAKPEQTAYWRDRLGPKIRPRVGLVWNGGFRPDQPELWALNERRNIPLRVISRLNVPHIDFFSLQKGEPAESELLALQEEFWPGSNFYNFMNEISDFDGTAGLIANLDLVISVDTSTAHLAGAMGKPVWLLNRFDTCWRWLEHRDDSPWYPTVRLFRQAEHGDWEGVIQRVNAALAEKFGANTPRMEK